jgi:hypothetical protein
LKDDGAIDMDLNDSERARGAKSPVMFTEVLGLDLRRLEIISEFAEKMHVCAHVGVDVSELLDDTVNEHSFILRLMHCSKLVIMVHRIHAKICNEGSERAFFSPKERERR